MMKIKTGKEIELFSKSDLGRAIGVMHCMLADHIAAGHIPGPTYPNGKRHYYTRKAFDAAIAAWNAWKPNLKRIQH